jgi:uncharacterized protein (DUF2141 family)
MQRRNIIVILWPKIPLMRRILLFFSVSVILIGCAKRGMIDGGPKDTVAPVLLMSFPKNYSTEFKGNEIQLIFDEYVKLKNVNKQLIVSPPMETPPEILPTTASKKITIKLKDTLKLNTTYSLNFGQSIEDYNESNPYPQFKYVFSTGTYIDSLALNGVIKDALSKTPDNFVSVMLYEAETFTDSTIYKKPPRYITNTLDSSKVFRLENLKAGDYYIVALKDVNNNYRFDPKSDKIAFHKEIVRIPNDTLYEMELFSEVLPFKAFKPSQAEGNRLILGYQGRTDDIKVTVTSGEKQLRTTLTKFPDKDSLYVWHEPVVADSLKIRVMKGDYDQLFTTKIKKQKSDTLSISPMQAGSLTFRDTLALKSSRPLMAFDPSKISIAKKDSTQVIFTTAYDEMTMRYKLIFPIEPLENYRLLALPGAVTDFYGATNDTLKYSFKTRNTSDYGNLRVTLENIKNSPVIVQLTDDKGKVKAVDYIGYDTTLGATHVIDFMGLDPMLYTLRIIYDENRNRRWDTGDYLLKRQTEDVIYFPKSIDVRANWDVDQPFSLP